MFSVCCLSFTSWEMAGSGKVLCEVLSGRMVMIRKSLSAQFAVEGEQKAGIN